MEEKLWNEIKDNSEYSNNKELYQNHILEQYKMYVEMADRISSRRNLANAFFLSINSTILGSVAFLFDKIQLVQPKWIIISPIIGTLLLCLIWWWLLSSYRKLNTAKYKVVGQLEKRLPASPYWSAEWYELGEGKDPEKYLPLTALEKWIPMIFASTYIMIAVYVAVLMK